MNKYGQNLDEIALPNDKRDKRLKGKESDGWLLPGFTRVMSPGFNFFRSNGNVHPQSCLYLWHRRRVGGAQSRVLISSTK